MLRCSRRTLAPVAILVLLSAAAPARIIATHLTGRSYLRWRQRRWRRVTTAWSAPRIPPSDAAIAHSDGRSSIRPEPAVGDKRRQLSAQSCHNVLLDLRSAK